MRTLYPEPGGEVDIAELYEGDARAPHPERPWLLINMVTTADGATTVEGRSGGLGNAADRTLLGVLRSLSDVVLAGAGTVRAESYGPPRTTKAAQERRVARGQQAHPRIAIVTARLQLDLTSPLFTDTPTRPLLMTSAAAPAELRAAAAEVADVLITGEQQVDVAEGFRQLHQLGVRHVTCEGGPTLNHALLRAGLIDEWCLSLSPLLVSGTSARGIAGPEVEVEDLRLERVAIDDGLLFLRYVRA